MWREFFNNSDLKLLRSILAICIFLKRFGMTYHGLCSEALYFQFLLGNCFVFCFCIILKVTSAFAFAFFSVVSVQFWELVLKQVHSKVRVFPRRLICMEGIVRACPTLPYHLYGHIIQFTKIILMHHRFHVPIKSTNHKKRSCFYSNSCIDFLQSEPL